MTGSIIDKGFRQYGIAHRKYLDNLNPYAEEMFSRCLQMRSCETAVHKDKCVLFGYG